MMTYVTQKKKKKKQNKLLIEGIKFPKYFLNEQNEILIFFFEFWDLNFKNF